MADCKDIPLAKDLLNSKTPIDIQTAIGIIQLTPFQIRRGEGKRKWEVWIEGFCRSEPPQVGPCCAFFKGREIGGNFSKVQKANNNVWHVTFYTIIGIPEYWGESPE